MPRIAFEEGWFGTLRSGVVGGLITVVAAAIWFFATNRPGILAVQPLVLGGIGIIAITKGLLDRE